MLEIVIDGLTHAAVARGDARGARRRSPISARERGALRIGAGNYGGKLGQHHYHLKDLLP